MLQCDQEKKDIKAKSSLVIQSSRQSHKQLFRIVEYFISNSKQRIFKLTHFYIVVSGILNIFYEYLKQQQKRNFLNPFVTTSPTRTRKKTLTNLLKW